MEAYLLHIQTTQLFDGGNETLQVPPKQRLYHPPCHMMHIVLVLALVLLVYCCSVGVRVSHCCTVGAMSVKQ